MELLDRYLQAVGFWLPKAQQNDIISELADDLRSQIEDKESSLGREINEDELAAILQHAGHPMRVAARYKKQQSLIGPALFPLYKFVLMIVTLGYLVPWLMAWLARLALVVFAPAYRPNHVLTVIGGWGAFWTNIFIIFGIVTLLFAILERVQSNASFLDKWDPRKLPRAPKPKPRVSRVESVFGLVFSIFFVVWWLSLPYYGHIVFDRLDGALALNPALRVYFLPALVPTLVLIVQQCINLFRPQWTWLRALFMLLADVITLVIVAAVIKTSPYLVLIETAKDASRYARALPMLNQIIAWSLISLLVGIFVVMVIHTYLAARELRRIRNASHTQASIQISQLL
jgi:hypothetical protein